MANTAKLALILPIFNHLKLKKGKTMTRVGRLVIVPKDHLKGKSL